MRLASTLVPRLGYAPAIIVPRLAAMAAVLVFTRILPPEQFGLYALAIVYGELLDSVALSWTRLGVQRFHHVADIDAADLRRKAALASIAGVAVGVLLASLLALSNEETSTWSFFAMLFLYFVGAGLLRHGLNLLRAQNRVLAYVLVECVRPLVGLAVAWALTIRWSSSFVAPAVGTFSVTALFALGLLVLVGPAARTGSQRIPFAEYLRYSAPLIGVFLVSQAISSSDRYLLGAYGGPALVGIYAACTAIARPPIETLFNIINTSAYPRLLKAFELQGEAAAARELRGQLGVLVLIGLPALVGLWLVARPLSEVLLDPRYRTDAEWIIRLSSLAAFLANLKCFFSDQVFHLRKNSLLQTLTLVPGALATVGGGVLLISSHGGVGAAAALALGYSIAALLSFLLAQRQLRVMLPWPVISRCLLACLAMVVVDRFIAGVTSEVMLVLSVVGCAATYLVVCHGVGVLRVLEHQSQ